LTTPIVQKEPNTGRLQREDNTILNMADLEGGKDVLFHDAAIIPAVGPDVLIGGYNTLLVEIYGTSATRLVNFMGKSKSGTARPILGYKENDLTYTAANNTISSGELWKFDVAGLDSVSMQVAAVATGNVSIKGRLVE